MYDIFVEVLATRSIPKDSTIFRNFPGLNLCYPIAPWAPPGMTPSYTSINYEEVRCTPISKYSSGEKMHQIQRSTGKTRMVNELPGKWRNRSSCIQKFKYEFHCYYFIQSLLFLGWWFELGREHGSMDKLDLTNTTVRSERWQKWRRGCGWYIHKEIKEN